MNIRVSKEDRVAAIVANAFCLASQHQDDIRKAMVAKARSEGHGPTLWPEPVRIDLDHLTLPEPLSEARRDALAFVAKRRTVTTRQTADEPGIGMDLARLYLTRLESRGAVSGVHSGRTGGKPSEWTITPAGRKALATGILPPATAEAIAKAKA